MSIVKFQTGKYMVPVSIEEKGSRLYLQFPYNKVLLAEVKSMQGAKWHGYDEDNPRKIWSIKNCSRNRFQLAFLQGQNPYERYDAPLVNGIKCRPECYKHQVVMVQHGLARRQCEIAGEMGTGKTLAAIEVIEHSGYLNWVWVGPRSALAAVKLDFSKWKALFRPRFMTYERMRIDFAAGNFVIPDGIIFDEAAKVKSPTSQRSQAAFAITEQMREQNPDCYIILMTGAPAPKSPADWWHQCEVACPGFLKEGDFHKFKHRLALIKEKESITGGVYPELVTWLDNSAKCAICGKLMGDHSTGVDALVTEKASDHQFQESVDEVSLLYKRMQGLVLVKFKRDCLDLPERQYRLIEVPASESIKRAANLITTNSARTIQALTLLRELSDGFQYKEEKSGTKTCDRCNGEKETLEWYDPNSEEGETLSEEAIQSGRCKQRLETCPHCNGTGVIATFTRVAKEIPCPKEILLGDLLDEHEPIGRFVVYAGFEASVDRCVRKAVQFGWDVVRVDGRGWSYFLTNMKQVRLTEEDMLRCFQNVKADDSPEKLCFIGQPGAAGMGLTLTASPSVFFYSNSFNGEDRIQAMDRIHRIGMDTQRGATIIDVVHLPVDRYILDNLKKKIDLQALTMGQLRDATNDQQTEGVERAEYDRPDNS